MTRSRNQTSGTMLCALMILFMNLQPPANNLAQGKALQNDPRPVPTKNEIIKAWRKRQDAVKSARFAWTERQTHTRGWIANPRHPERERLANPAPPDDLTYSVSKALAFDGNKLRYTYEGKKEADGKQVLIDYSYVSVFDGQMGNTYLYPPMIKTPAVVRRGMTNGDAQNLDTRPILLAFRPLDPMMGHLSLDRADTSHRMGNYKGRSYMILEEPHDPSGWKSSVWIEPDRDYIVSRYRIYFQQKLVEDIEIDYTEDPRWGWIPIGWQIAQMKADGSTSKSAVSKVTAYTINLPINSEEFR
jgi:hypothetical protein